MTVGVALRDAGDAVELPVRHDAIGNAQAAHVGVLSRRNVEEPVKAPAEIVDALGIGAIRTFALEARVGIEGMFVALGFFLAAKLAAPRLEPRHRRQMRRIGPTRLCPALAAARQRLETGRRA
jgi:hypothetical protein